MVGAKEHEVRAGKQLYYIMPIFTTTCWALPRTRHPHLWSHICLWLFSVPSHVSQQEIMLKTNQGASKRLNSWTCQMWWTTTMMDLASVARETEVLVRLSRSRDMICNTMSWHKLKTNWSCQDEHMPCHISISYSGSGARWGWSRPWDPSYLGLPNLHTTGVCRISQSSSHGASAASPTTE